MICYCLVILFSCFLHVGAFVHMIYVFISNTLSLHILSLHDILSICSQLVHISKADIWSFFRLRRKIRGTSCPPITTHLLRMLYVVLSIISMGVQFSVLQKSEQSMWAERKTERSEPKTDVSGAERSPVNWAERWAVILPLTLCSHVLFLFFFLNFMF